MWNANGRFVPYGLSESSECFDPETGKFLLGPSRYGLTCSSFIVAVFKLAGFTLLDESTWPSMREGDLEWKQQMLGILEEWRLKQKASTEHVKRFSDDHPFLRIRPEEVAASSLVDPLPATFDQATPKADEILKMLGCQPKPTIESDARNTPDSGS
ncbi:MAG: hypothetical protein QM775_34925 [Pirellulales bacterium]